MRHLNSFEWNDPFYCFIPRFKGYSVFRVTQSGRLDEFVDCDTLDMFDDKDELWIIGANEAIPTMFVGWTESDSMGDTRDVRDLKLQIDSGGRIEMERIDVSQAFKTLLLLQGLDDEKKTSIEKAYIVAEWCKTNGLPQYHRIRMKENRCSLFGFCVGGFLTDVFTFIREKQSIDGRSPRPDVVNNSVDLRIGVDFSKDPPSFRLVSLDFMHAVRCGLFFESISGIGLSIEVCHDCGKLFIPNRNGQQYCDECGTPAARKRRERERDKAKNGGVHDGKEAR